MFGSGAKHSLDKTESSYCSYGSLPICKKGSSYLISLKCYLKGLTMSWHNLDYTKLVCNSYGYMSKCKEGNLINQTLLELLEFQESWNLIR